MNTPELIYIGTKAHVAAVQRRDGKLVWQTKLTGGLKVSGSGLVTLLSEDGHASAYTYGKPCCLDAASGQESFACEVPGLGCGIASLATVGHCSPPVTAAAQAAAAADDNAAAAGAS